MKPTIQLSSRVAGSASPACTVSEQRLLIPVKRGDDADYAIAYAIRRRAEGVRVSVCLLHVEELDQGGQAGLSWNSAPARTRRRDRVFADALNLLSGLDIDVSAYVRKGAVVFTILDAAEELDCQEIVIRRPPAGVLRWLSRDVVVALLAGQRRIRVVAVGKDGMDSLR